MPHILFWICYHCHKTVQSEPALPVSPPSVFGVRRAVIKAFCLQTEPTSHVSGSSLLRGARRCVPMTLRGICPNRILSTNTKAFHRPISPLEFVQIVNKQKHLTVGSRDNMSDACVPRSESRCGRRWTCTYVFGVIGSLCLWHHGACGSTCLQLVLSH